MSAHDDDAPERRKPQRDWAGHTIFAILTVGGTLIGGAVAFGYPIISAWNQYARTIEHLQTQQESLQSGVAAIQSLARDLAQLQIREQNTERNVTSLQTFQATTATVLSETNKVLGMLKQQLDDLTPALKSLKPGR